MAKPDDAARNAPRPGTLVLVVGPSGAGKDSLIEAARRHFESDPRICFPRRWVTRRADAGGARHVAMSEQDFDRLCKGGGFALSWRAHGLGYGIPSEVAGEIAAGRMVVVNVSRAVVGEARRRFPGLRVCHVTASRAALVQRLAARGRETTAEVEARLARLSDAPVAGADVTEIANDGPLEPAIGRFIELLRGFLS